MNGEEFELTKILICKCEIVVMSFHGFTGFKTKIGESAEYKQELTIATRQYMKPMKVLQKLLYIVRI